MPSAGSSLTKLRLATFVFVFALRLVFFFMEAIYFIGTMVPVPTP
jgi:hypothetical protein